MSVSTSWSLYPEGQVPEIGGTIALRKIQQPDLAVAVHLPSQVRNIVGAEVSEHVLANFTLIVVEPFQPAGKEGPANQLEISADSSQEGLAPVVDVRSQLEGALATLAKGGFKSYTISLLTITYSSAAP